MYKLLNQVKLERKGFPMKHLSSLVIRWISLAIILIVLGLIWAIFNHLYIYTSDAFVDGQVMAITPQIDGKVIKVFTHEGMTVKKGQPLLKIDATPYLLQLDQDIAALQTARNDRAQIVASIQSAKVTEKAARLSAFHTFQLWHHMSGTARIAFSRQDIKTARYNFDAALADYDKSQHDITVLQKQLGPKGQPYPPIVKALADIKTDKFNLTKTILRAPNNGIVTNDHLLPGAIATAGQPLFALVEPSKFWITARYKEGSLRNMKLGQRVSVYLGMYSWHRFTGTVTDMGYGVNRRQASNAVVSSTLPYLEQTENWIQLSQRFPVRIKLDQAPKNMPYRIGASARVFIHRT